MSGNVRKPFILILDKKRLATIYNSHKFLVILLLILEYFNLITVVHLLLSSTPLNSHLNFGIHNSEQLYKTYPEVQGLNMRETALLLAWSVFGTAESAEAIPDVRNTYCNKNELELPPNARRWPGISDVNEPDFTSSPTNRFVDP